jgi:hypothetical protein
MRAALSAAIGTGCGPGYPLMLLMEADGDADMLLIDEGVLFADGCVPLDGAEDGMFMFVGEPPRPMLWWIATYQFQTFSCGAPATMPRTWPSSWVQTMYSRPWVKLQDTRRSRGARGQQAGRVSRPVRSKNYFDYAERTGMLHYRDTELRSAADHLTHTSGSGSPRARRRRAAYPGGPQRQPVDGSGWGWRGACAWRGKRGEEGAVRTYALHGAEPMAGLDDGFSAHGVIVGGGR